MIEGRCGLTRVFYDGKTLTIKHTGNMGNDIEHSVNPNLKSMELKSVKYYKENYETEESGSPDYLYELKVKNIKLKRHD